MWIIMLFEFSHLKFQKGLWIEHKYENSIGFYEEDMCKYFDDLYLEDHYAYQLKEGFIKQEEFNAT